MSNILDQPVRNSDLGIRRYSALGPGLGDELGSPRTIRTVLGLPSSATTYLVEYPNGSGTELTLAEVADELGSRLIDIFVPNESGRRPVFGTDEKFQTDPVWNSLIPFHEYFHGDTGRGVGASHQTGWTGLVPGLMIRRGRDVATFDEMMVPSNHTTRR